jgi:hypothetical protein
MSPVVVVYCVLLNSQVLKYRPHHPIVKNILLFPTLQHIAQTPQGKRVSMFGWPVIRHLMAFFIMVLSWLFALWPKWVYVEFVGFLSGMKSGGGGKEKKKDSDADWNEDCSEEEEEDEKDDLHIGLNCTATKLLSGYRPAFHVLSLVQDEMREVKDLPVEVLAKRENVGRCAYYYSGKVDMWAPQSHADDVKRLVVGGGGSCDGKGKASELDLVECDMDIPHSFVLG